jgi:mRNA deadenylase 3'-5' endonuclease subunit Ccr4
MEGPPNAPQTKEEHPAKKPAPSDASNLLSLQMYVDPKVAARVGSFNRAKVFTLNLLAQCYATYHISNYQGKPECIQAAPRARLLLQMLDNASPDLFALQEVDPDLWGQLEPTLKRQYALYTCQRPSGKLDGLVIGYRRSVFSEICRDTLCFDSAAKRLGIVEQDFQTHHIAQYIRLHWKSNVQAGPPEILHVYNTHLFWNPARDDVKYFQFASLLSLASTRHSPSDHSIILGDFNSLPNSNSLSLLQPIPPQQGRIESVHNQPQIFHNSQSVYSMMDLQSIGSKGWRSVFSEYREFFKRIGVETGLDKPFIDTGGYPLYTNSVESFRGVIDHIITTKNVVTLGMSLLPSISLPLPNAFYPSDHIPLVAILSFTQ